jgi:hypothetical protein
MMKLGQPLSYSLSQVLIIIETSSSAYPYGMLTRKTAVGKEGGRPMRFYTKVHDAYCGIDLHARSMYVCIINRDGEMMLHRNMPTTPAGQPEGPHRRHNPPSRRAVDGPGGAQCDHGGLGLWLQASTSSMTETGNTAPPFNR